MNLEEVKEDLKRIILDGENAKKELELLNTKKEVDNKFIYENIKTIFTIQQKEGKFKEILGGDGRSQPWDKDAEGVIVTIKLNETIFFNSEQEKIIKGIVKNMFDADHYEFTA